MKTKKDLNPEDWNTQFSRWNNQFSRGIKAFFVIFILIFLIALCSSPTTNNKETSQTKYASQPSDSVQEFFQELEHVQKNIEKASGIRDMQLFSEKRKILPSLVYLTFGIDTSAMGKEQLKDLAHTVMTIWAKKDNGRTGYLKIKFYNTYNREIMQASYSSLSGIKITEVG